MDPPSKHGAPNVPEWSHEVIFFGNQTRTLYECSMWVIFRFHFYNVRRMFWGRSLNLKGKF